MFAAKSSAPSTLESLGEKVEALHKIGKVVWAIFAVVGAGSIAGIKAYAEWSVAQSKQEANTAEAKQWREDTDKWKTKVDNTLGTLTTASELNARNGEATKKQLNKVSKVVDKMANLNGVLLDN